MLWRWSLVFVTFAFLLSPVLGALLRSGRETRDARHAQRPYNRQAPLPGSEKAINAELKWPSPNYRVNAAKNRHQIVKGANGEWTYQLNRDKRDPRYHNGVVEQGDHLHEAQSALAGMKASGTPFHEMTRDDRREVAAIFNSKHNLQFLRASPRNLNAQKLHVVRNGLEGKLRPMRIRDPHFYKDRDGYTTAAIRPAAHNAAAIDWWLKDTGKTNQPKVLTTHLDSMKSAGFKVDPKLQKLGKQYEKMAQKARKKATQTSNKAPGRKVHDYLNGMERNGYSVSHLRYLDPHHTDA